MYTPYSSSLWPVRKCHYNALQPVVEEAASDKAYHSASDAPSGPGLDKGSPQGGQLFVSCPKRIMKNHSNFLIRVTLQ